MSHDAGERLVGGRWTLHSPLRRAERGVIWRATEVATGRPLAVEQLRLPEGADPAGQEQEQASLWQRVAAEARAAASLTGPALVRRVAQLGLELLDALEAVHAAGLAHLDLRPANVLVAPTSPIPAAFSPPWREAQPPVHSSLERLRRARNTIDTALERVLLVAGGSVLLALVSFAAAVALSGDVLGLRSQAVAPTAVPVPPTTLPPPSTVPPATVAPSTAPPPVVPPG